MTKITKYKRGGKYISAVTTAGLLLATAGSLLGGFALTAQAAVAPSWNASGTYVVGFTHGDTSFYDVNLVQDSVGNMTGTGSFPSGGPASSTWHVTSGAVTGNNIDLTALYDTGATGTVLHMTGAFATSGSMAGTWDDNMGSTTRNGTWSTTAGAALPLGSLAAEDFGVMNESGVKGYTAGFGLTDATFAGVQSVVTKLYSSTTLLQTDTATAKVGTDITGSQISSPFDVFGTFNYAADGFWTNTRESEYGQTLVPTRVVATVTLANGKMLTAENNLLSGDTTTIFPTTTPQKGSLNLVNLVSGGTATSSDFLIHLKMNGSEASGSPQAGSITGNMYSGLATGTYVVSATGGPVGYTPTYSGACDASGNAIVVANATSTCTVTNTFSSGGSTTTPQTGSLNVTKTVIGGTATASNFMVHVMASGTDITGSPQAGSASGTVYSGLTPRTYVVSETGGPAGYTPSFSGSCDTSGNVNVLGSTTVNCMIINTYATPTVPVTGGSGSLKVLKFVGGGTAVASDFMIHVMASGTDIAGSPQAGSMSGTTYTGLATSTYSVSETGGPAGYTTYFFGDCDISGNTLIDAWSVKTCLIANIYAPQISTSTGVISGTTYNDLNRNNKKGGNEPGIKGFVINLYNAPGWSGGANPIPFMTATTNAAGNYSFKNLPDGTYSVEEVNNLPGWTQQTGDYSPLVIQNGQKITNTDFANTQKRRGDREKPRHTPGNNR